MFVVQDLQSILHLCVFTILSHDVASLLLFITPCLEHYVEKYMITIPSCLLLVLLYFHLHCIRYVKKKKKKKAKKKNVAVSVVKLHLISH